MKTLRSTKNVWMAEMAGLLARWFLGAVFVCLGFSKALHPVEFLKLIRQYDAVHTPWLLNSIAAALPWFEVVCGALLLAGIAVRGSALLVTGFLVLFTWMVVHRALALQLGIPFCAIKFDCGCGAGEVFICRKLLENAGLTLLSTWLLAGRGRRFCLRYRLTQHGA
jgi:uncharacterized membrane protein YphA (DoxX/SURF4 family)